MGVVFRAHDSRLQRDVALKLLPDGFAGDADRLSRFEREAQVLASLNHANIAQIYGLEQVNGATCIVMELVEGETLEDRLKRGPLSFDEAIDISRQVAEALAVAHERGIVHRDLKPANIKITPNGTVKVLDFGLAKALGPKADMSFSSLPTMASGSIVGAVVGTPGYMSPEQARGKEVDARTDIWAFGCVLYEMLTAQQAFSGETITDVMAKIVTSPPDLDQLPKNTPPAIRLLLSSVLNKNASQRLQHIGDTRLFLDGTLANAAAKAEAAPAPKGIRGKLAAVALLVALVALAIPAALYFRNASTPAPQMRLDIMLPGMVGTPVLSPDGRSIAFAIPSDNGRAALWIRPLASETATPVPGTEGVGGVIWSRDSKSLAITVDGKLRIINLTDGSSRVGGDVGQIRGGSWNQDDVILLARAGDNIIVRVSDSGGAITPVTKLNKERGEVLHVLPVFMPDGDHFIYLAAGGKPEDTGIYYASLTSTEEPKLVLQVDARVFSAMAYVDGYVVFQNQGRLVAHRMDENGRTEGSAFVLADGVDGAFGISNTGILMYHKSTPPAGKQLLWFNREGKQVGQVGAVANYGNVDISPKGDRAAIDMITNGNRDVWVIDLARSVAQPITTDPGSDWTASWSPDGSRLAFASTRAANKNVTRIYEKSSTGMGTERILPSGNDASIPVHWSGDGKYIVFSRLRAAGNTSSYDTWILPLSGEGEPSPLLETGFDKFQARISPDSRYVAYSTNESGTYQIVVQTFPDPNGGKWQISANGGTEPKWRRDSRELYYLAMDGKLMSVSIGGPTFSAGKPVEMFQTPLTVSRGQPTRDRRYDIAPDGRFLMVVPSDTGPALPYSIVVNWKAGLEK